MQPYCDDIDNVDSDRATDGKDIRMNTSADSALTATLIVAVAVKNGELLLLLLLILLLPISSQGNKISWRNPCCNERCLW